MLNAEDGPGLSWMSPDKIMRKKKEKDVECSFLLDKVRKKDRGRVQRLPCWRVAVA
jgi:hypothetical protein